MSLDIIVFAVVAAVLIARLRSVLGTKHGDERQRPNPFEGVKDEPSLKPHAEAQAMAVSSAIDRDPRNAAHTVVIDDSIIKTDEKSVERVKDSLKDIAAADSQFNPNEFLQGAKMAFEMITDYFAKGDRDGLRPLLSEDLYEAFESVIADRADKGLLSKYELHRIKDARIQDARLGGVMAYVTVDFDIEQTTTLTDKKGKVIEGDPDKISETHDIWTFARDIRNEDPNWELVATRLGDG